MKRTRDPITVKTEEIARKMHSYLNTTYCIYESLLAWQTDSNVVIPSKFIIVNGIWIHHYTPKKSSSLTSVRKQLKVYQKAKTVPSAGNVVAPFSWGSDRVVPLNYS